MMPKEICTMFDYDCFLVSQNSFRVVHNVVLKKSVFCILKLYQRAVTL